MSSEVMPSVAPVERRSLSDAVFEQLRTQILAGRLEPGVSLPSERKLCRQFGVNRNALREALKRLEQLRLVVIRQGESTRVLDFRDTGGLELLVGMLFDENGQLSLPVARSFVEMRAALGPDIARLAAQRRTSRVLPKLEAALARLRACDRHDAVALQRASFELWRVLVHASDNLAYQLAFNTMERVWSQVQDALAPVLLAEVSHIDGYEELVTAVRKKRSGAASKAAQSLVSRGSRSVSQLLARLAAEEER